jgi:hypothetical protein
VAQQVQAGDRQMADRRRAMLGYVHECVHAPSCGIIPSMQADSSLWTDPPHTQDHAHLAHSGWLWQVANISARATAQEAAHVAALGEAARALTAHEADWSARLKAARQDVDAAALVRRAELLGGQGGACVLAWLGEGEGVRSVCGGALGHEGANQMHSVAGA